jgi:hypothetical protein
LEEQREMLEYKIVVRSPGIHAVAIDPKHNRVIDFTRDRVGDKRLDII